MIHVTKVLKPGEVTVCALFKGLKVVELKAILRAKILSVTGNRADLVARLLEAGVKDSRIE